MLAFAPGTMAAGLPTTKETAITCGDVLDYVRLVNESNVVQTVTTMTSGDVEMGSIRLQPGEVMILWKRRQFHKMYASSAEVIGTGGMVRPSGLGTTN